MGSSWGPRTEEELRAFGAWRADTLWPSEGREDSPYRAVDTCGAVLLRSPAPAPGMTCDYQSLPGCQGSHPVWVRKMWVDREVA